MKNQVKINQWLKERNLVCEENLGETLYNLVLEYSEKNQVTLESVWKKLGVTKQNINFWRYHDQSSMTQLQLKRNVIENAKGLFNLEEKKVLNLAESAGLTRFVNGTTVAHNTGFSEHFVKRLTEWSGRQKSLYEKAGIDKKMFYRIKSGKNLRKETLLALFLVLELSLDEIQYYLGLAGYTLSYSFPMDIVVLHLMETSSKGIRGDEFLYKINDLLYELGLPLLQSCNRNNRKN